MKPTHLEVISSLIGFCVGMLLFALSNMYRENAPSQHTGHGIVVKEFSRNTIQDSTHYNCARCGQKNVIWSWDTTGFIRSPKKHK